MRGAQVELLYFFSSINFVHFFVFTMATPLLLSEAVTTIDLLQSIYFDNEFEFQHTEDQEVYTQLYACWESDNWTSTPKKLPKNLEFTIKAPIELTEEDDPVYLIMNGRISLISSTDYQLSIPSSLNLWLSRDDHLTLVNALNTFKIDNHDDRSTWIIETIQHLQVSTEPFATIHNQTLLEKAKKEQLSMTGGPVTMLRDWIWFPMIYTREKVSYIFRAVCHSHRSTHLVLDREVILSIGHRNTTSLAFYVQVNPVACV